MMKTAEIREAFLKFFESKNHTRVASSSLVPAGDPTLLFTNAGMVQFKDLFLGQEKRPYIRATTCQKSLRISGKHNDLENVGRTARHHTFFEMLGNFSFGDYFKEQAIVYAWEFITEVLKLPKDRLWVTIFESDDEAQELWEQKTDLLKGRVVRCGEKDNFWAMGETGPCGPCTEIFYFLGEDVKSQSEQDFRKDDGTYIEIWNLVFMQFNRDLTGKLTPLPKPSVDTGMGLERVAAVKQGAKANYDADGLRAIISVIEDLSLKKYLGKDYSARSFGQDSQYATDVAMRVVTDHSRSCSFLIADGVLPSSDGRGYVLRRLVRRACRYGRILGFNQPFLYKVAEKVIEFYASVYPELVSAKNEIIKIIKDEEEKFLSTLETGLTLLNKEIASTNGDTFSGAMAFKLHDTFGFPLDLTQDILKQENMEVDAAGFEAAMQAQRERSRSARQSEAKLMLQRSIKPSKTEFVGYQFDQYESNIVALYDESGEVKEAYLGKEVALVVAQSPFYGESGGQVGDAGIITGKGFSLDVMDTQKIAGDTLVHLALVTEGKVSNGDRVRLEIDASRRKKIRINHSATHLLHAALQTVLGDQVRQAGSRVSDKSLRFDFNSSAQVSEQQLLQIETIVNEMIRENHLIVTEVLPIEKAKQKGAMALFGEKYGEIVRVVTMGPGSVEFCGGTHASRTGDIGFFSIIQESSVSAGVRRVEACSGLGAEDFLRTKSKTLKKLGMLLSAPEIELDARIEKLVLKNSELELELDKLRKKIHLSSLSPGNANDSDLDLVREDGTKVIIRQLEQANPQQLREVADHLRNQQQKACLVLASVVDGKAVFLTAVTSNLLDRYHAGKLIQEIVQVVGGKGGGKSDLAQAGGGDPEKISEALLRFQELIQ